MRTKEVEKSIDDFNFFNEGEYITKEMAESKDKVLAYIEELEEENRIQRGQLNSAFDNGFIHKDKIRDKIKELEEEKDKEKYVTDIFFIKAGQIEVLKKILGE